ncbi:hypothetical protein K438DRAFT_1776490 [Mycena galopus ATCC 62051]|nr:hypothetical protein K438DRAFT_1776490 [Mycena galopus ATCC 62051]
MAQDLGRRLYTTMSFPWWLHVSSHKLPGSLTSSVITVSSREDGSIPCLFQDLQWWKHHNPYSMFAPIQFCFIGQGSIFTLNLFVTDFRTPLIALQNLHVDTSFWRVQGFSKTCIGLRLMYGCWPAMHLHPMGSGLSPLYSAQIERLLLPLSATAAACFWVKSVRVHRDSFWREFPSLIPAVNPARLMELNAYTTAIPDIFQWILMFNIDLEQDNTIRMLLRVHDNICVIHLLLQDCLHHSLPQCLAKLIHESLEWMGGSW